MMSRSRRTLARIAVLATLALSATGAVAQTPQPKKGGTVVMAMGYDPVTLNPATSSGTSETHVGTLMFEALVQTDLDGRVHPQLAKSWDISDDKLTYTFHLQEAKFHDGKPFTSEDVKFSFLDVANKLHTVFRAQAGRVIQSIETPDPRTVVVRLKEPFGPFLYSLGLFTGGAIVPKHVFEGTDVATNPASVNSPIGTGPFKFAEFVRGSHIRVVRNEDYWDKGKPYLDTVVVQNIPTPAGRTQAFLAGDIDFIPFSFFNSGDLKSVRANPNLKTEPTGSPPANLFGFLNLKNPALADVRVRQALMMATNRKFIWQNGYSETGQPGNSPWGGLVAWAHDPTVDYDKMYPFDTRKAGALLDEAGFKPDADGVRLRLRVMYDAASQERAITASALQATWKQAGIEVTVQPVENAVLTPRALAYDFDVFLTAYVTWGDPALGVARAFVSSSIGVANGNMSGYSNKEIDNLFIKGARATSNEERAPFYHQAERILARDMPSLMLHERRALDVANSNVQGLWGTQHVNWANGWLKQ
jgi:peptide/nickel transport system substrate-binding protein